MNENWKSMRGGTKGFELRKHWQEIKLFYEANGEEATLSKYHMKPDTLARLMANEPWGSKLSHFSVGDRNEMLASMALEGVSEVRKQITELKEAWTKFVESVGEQLAIKFFLPLLHNKIELPPELNTKEDHRIDLIEFPQKYTEQPDVIAEAERLLSDTPVDIDDRLDQAFSNLWGQYIRACDSGDWALALAAYQQIFEFNLIMDEWGSPDFIQSAEEWASKAEGLNELTIEWRSGEDICRVKP